MAMSGDLQGDERQGGDEDDPQGLSLLCSSELRKLAALVSDPEAIGLELAEARSQHAALEVDCLFAPSTPKKS
jgi:hypothetical protein